MATLTITTTAPQDSRIAPAFGSRLGLAGNANAAQVKAEVIQFIRSVVQDYEIRVAAKAAADAVTTIDPT